MIRRSFLALLLVALPASILACGQQEASLSDLKMELSPLPKPDISGAGTRVQEQIREHQERVAELTTRTKVEQSDLAEAFIDLALVYVAYEFLDSASVCLANAEKLQPSDHRTLYLHGHVLKIQGHLTTAHEILGRANSLKPRDVPTMIRLGRTQLELGEIEPARVLFEAALEQDPSASAATEGLARIEVIAGNYPTAVELFVRVLEEQPSATSVHYSLSQAYRNLGDSDKSAYHLELRGTSEVLLDDPYLKPIAELAQSAQFFEVQASRAMDDRRYDAAAADYRKVLEFEPNDLSAHLALSFCLQQLGDTQGAIDQLQVAIALPRREDQRDGVAEIHTLLGQLLSAQGNEQAALDSFRTAVKLEPERIDIRSELADKLARSGLLNEALTEYGRILKQAPNNIGALVKRATVRINLGQREPALADFARAVEIDPDNPNLRNRYAEALAFLGLSTEAAKQRQQAGLAATGDRQQAELRASEARQEAQKGRLENAAAAYEEALLIDPGMVIARYEFGTLLGRLGRYKKATDEFETVLAAHPHHSGAHRGLITALLLGSQYNQAKLKLRGALQSMPRDVALAHTLARLLAIAPDAGVRDGNLAVELAQRVHQVDPTLETAVTLAMALAESGDWSQAAHVQRNLVLEKIGPSGEEQSRLKHQGLLSSYEARQPVRVKSPEDILSILHDTSS